MRLILSLALCCCLATAVRAQNWPQFRGPNASGVADGRALPTAWDAAKSVNVLWRTAIPGLAHSSPIVWGERVFITTAISSEANPTFAARDRGSESARDAVKHTWRIYCLDRRGGRILWERTAHEGVPRASRHVKASQANSTPATDGRVVVALMGSEGLFAYDVYGKLLWKQDLGVLNPGLWSDPTSEWGHSSSPVIYRGLVIVQADGHRQSFIAAYDLKTGKRAWRVERGEITSWSTPTVYEGKTRAEVVANGGRYIRGYDPLTGRELWRFSDDNTEVKMQAPLVAHGLIYVTGGFPPGRAMYAFRPGAAGDISLKGGEETNRFVAWRSSKGSPYTPTPIVYGDYLYTCADNGVLTAYDARTGERIYQERLPSSFSASPVAADGKLYLASEDGEVYVVRAGTKFELLCVNPMGEPLLATPAISDGMMIVRGRHHVFAIARPVGEGAKLHYEVSGKGRTVVLIHGGLVDSRMWDDQYTEFARRYRVVRYDLRGFGRSEFPTKPFSHVEDLYALLKRLKVDKATVVGLSLGGMIAVDFALEHPEMVDGLVLAASALRGYQYKAVGNRQAIFEAAGGGNVEKAVALWMDDPVFASTKKYPAVERRARTMLTDNFKAWTSIPPTLLTWPSPPSVERLSAIRVPTLVVVGDRDNPNILGIAQLLEEGIAGAKKLILRGAGHHLNMEKPKEFNKAVLDFLKRGGGR